MFKVRFRRGQLSNRPVDSGKEIIQKLQLSSKRPYSRNIVIAKYYWNFKTQDLSFLQQHLRHVHASIRDAWEIRTGCW